MRIKNLQVGYTFPKTMIKGVRALRYFVRLITLRCLHRLNKVPTLKGRISITAPMPGMALPVTLKTVLSHLAHLFNFN
jgi:hypothetical protein